MGGESGTRRLVGYIDSRKAHIQPSTGEDCGSFSIATSSLEGKVAARLETSHVEGTDSFVSGGAFESRDGSPHVPDRPVPALELSIGYAVQPRRQAPL